MVPPSKRHQPDRTSRGRFGGGRSPLGISRRPLRPAPGLARNGTTCRSATHFESRVGGVFAFIRSANHACDAPTGAQPLDPPAWRHNERASVISATEAATPALRMNQSIRSTPMTENRSRQSRKSICSAAFGTVPLPLDSVAKMTARTQGSASQIPLNALVREPRSRGALAITNDERTQWYSFRRRQTASEREG